MRRERFFMISPLAVAVAIVMSSCLKMLKTDDDSETSTSGGSDPTAQLAFSLESKSYSNALIISDSTSSYGTSRLTPESSIKSELDSSKYLLTITNSSGTIIYDGKYIERPSALYVKAGKYTVTITSRLFDEPEFLLPLFGEERSVKALKDSVVATALESKQMTGGVRFVFNENFKNYFKGTGIYVKRDTFVRKYYYTDGRYLFFREGQISVIYKNKDGQDSYTPDDKPGYADTVLFTRKLKGEELVTITLDYDVTKISGGGMSIKFDTSRNRVSEYFNVAGIAPYGCHSILEAQKAIGDTMTVFGYIVGGDATSSKFSKEKPFKSKTHIVIASKDWQSLREKALAVELPSDSKMRQVLNLVDHPELLKRPIIVTGKVVDAYFGYPGLKSVKKYQLL